MAGEPGPRLRLYRGAEDPERPTARIRLLIEMQAPPKRLHEELDRVDRFLVTIARLHQGCSTHLAVVATSA